ncbi:MAG TPA: hypothetical protein VND91_12075 [Candidatus Saccharimonadia bacterium]|nr:hypothetical protein [Candidatus Saccharimonadia bacterium]
MLTRSWLVAALLAVTAPGASAITAVELIDTHIEARGGREKLRAIESRHSTGKMIFTGDNAIELGLSEIVTRDGRIRNEISLQGMNGIQAYDGTEAWQISPFQGRKDPDRMSDDDAKGLLDSLDIDGPLVDYQAKGHAVSYLGTEDVDGTDAHKLKLVEKDGDIKYIYLDPDYFLEIRETVQRKVRGVEQEYESDLGNYEQVAGVYMPFSIESGPKGGNKNQKIVLEKVEVNAAVDDESFHFPKTAAKPAAAN